MGNDKAQPHPPMNNEVDIDTILLEFATRLRSTDLNRLTTVVTAKQEARDRVAIHNKAKAAIERKYRSERLDELKNAASHFTDRPENFVYYNKRVKELSDD